MKIKIPKRQLQKYAQQLVRGNFGSLVQELDLLHVLPYNMYRKRDEHASKPADPIALVRLVSELGPGFVEAARILGSRGDIIPEQFQKQLLTFTYAPKPLRTKEVHASLKKAWRKPVSSVLSKLEDEPIYNTVLGYTYKGILHDGKRVFVTVHDADALTQFQENIKVLKWVHIWYSQRKTSYNALLFDNIEAELERRVDQLSDVMHVAARIEVLAAHYEKEDHVRVPEVFWEHTTPQVLVYRTYNAPVLAQIVQGKLHHTKTTAIVKKIIAAFLMQYGKAGTFLLRPKLSEMSLHEGKELVFNQLLATGVLDPEERTLFISLLLALSKGEKEQAAKALLKMHYAHNKTSHRGESGIVVHRVEGTLSEQLWGLIESAWHGGVHIPVGITMAAESFSYVEHMMLRIKPKVDTLKLVRESLSSVLKKR